MGKASYRDAWTHLKKPQIIKYPPLKWVTLSIPIVKSFHSRISYLDFSWHTSLSIESCWGPWGALRGPLGGPSVPEKGKQNASNHQISLCPPLKWVTLSIPIVKSSHSRIFYLDFLWHTSLSIENHWGPLEALRGPFSAWKQQTKCINSSNIPLSTSQVINAQYSHSEIIP